MYPAYRSRHSTGRFMEHRNYEYPVCHPSWFYFWHEFGEEKEDEVKSKPLKVNHVDTCITENVTNHNTNEYDITGKDHGEQLVLRRGQHFFLAVAFDRPYDKSTDRFQICLEIGDKPVVSKRTAVQLALEQRPTHISNASWTMTLEDVLDNTTLRLKIKSPADTIIGRWKLFVNTFLKKEKDMSDEEKEGIRRYAYPQPVYILFNPWCKEDDVYMEDEVWRDETVLNEYCRLFTGNHRQIGSRSWNIGQFDPGILECSLDLLDQASLEQTARRLPVRVCRAVSSIVNSSDDNGVLTGNWSGDYAGGTPPTQWAGSVAILQQFSEKKRSVQFGQCWVFSGVTTTVCRAVGIPTRSVTNFSSAHDCDGSMTIDRYYDFKGNKVDNMNQDSIWNFHVWNESWMTRPDLAKACYGGWQAFDATPQETSDGVYQAGPVSLTALKEGDVCFPHDGPFIFAEVNADCVDWTLDETNEWRPNIKKKKKVGRKISTQKPRMVTTESRTTWGTILKDDTRLDITHLYKHKEDSEEEKKALYRANQRSTICRLDIYKHHSEPVVFTFDLDDELLVGHPFDIMLKAKNRSRCTQKIKANLTICSCYYTGVVKKKLKKHTFEVELEPIKSKEMSLSIPYEDYKPFIVDQIGFLVNVHATVLHSEQVFTDEEQFRLRRPDLKVTAPKTGRVGEALELTIKLRNPLPDTLTNCSWQIEGPGRVSERTIKERDVDPGEEIEVKVNFTPTRPRSGGKVCVTFDSKELTDVTGDVEIDVEK